MPRQRFEPNTFSNINVDRYRYVNLMGSMVFLRSDGTELPDDKEPLLKEL